MFDEHKYIFIIHLSYNVFFLSSGKYLYYLYISPSRITSILVYTIISRRTVKGNRWLNTFLIRYQVKNHTLRKLLLKPHTNSLFFKRPRNKKKILLVYQQRWTFMTALKAIDFSRFSFFLSIVFYFVNNIFVDKPINLFSIYYLYRKIVYYYWS